MTDAAHPTGSVTVTPAPSPAPNVIVQQPGMVSALSSGLFDAFKTSPVLLLIVVLNGFFIGAAGYYLLQVEQYRADDRKALASLLDKCLTQSVPVDYLIRKQ